jgi:hypothetical protein
MLVKEANLVRNGNTIGASWEYDTDWDWKIYSTWVSNHLPGDYEPITGKTTKLQFRRRLSGDVFTLDIENIISQPPYRRIRVTFHAYPN